MPAKRGSHKAQKTPPYRYWVCSSSPLACLISCSLPLAPWCKVGLRVNVPTPFLTDYSPYPIWALCWRCWRIRLPLNHCCLYVDSHLLGLFCLFVMLWQVVILFGITDLTSRVTQKSRQTKIHIHMRHLLNTLRTKQRKSCDGIKSCFGSF